jgi:hypothetical protein
MSVNEAGLKENRLLNQDRLGETLEFVELAELGPDNEGVNGTGSMFDKSTLLVSASTHVIGLTYSSFAS